MFSKFWPTEVGLSTVPGYLPKFFTSLEAAIDTKGSGALVSTPVRGLIRSVSSGIYTCQCQAPSDRIPAAAAHALHEHPTDLEGLIRHLSRK